MAEPPREPGLTHFNLAPEVEGLLLTALSLLPKERPRYLASATDDPAIRARVEALLAEHAAADASLADLADRALDAINPVDEALPFSHAGPWKLVSVLGRGGMSVVYRVERDDSEFEQTAALKLLPTGPAVESLIRRFQAERRILARLEHPNLARLLDGGLSAEGMPWLVMEYVDGQPIDQYSDAHRLNIEQRLKLFGQVLAVVQYAHQNLIVHRDLKPSNILVTDQGQVKLLDFGIAKVLDEELGQGEATELTRVGGRPMTLAWSSPEQIAGETISTAADIYSLGVLLYKLLAGQLPFEDKSPNALEQAIREQTPAPPSIRVGRDETIARARSARPDALARRLRGDLDSIVLTCLQKSSERRYAAVGELSDDLERHRLSLPVRAQAGRWRYRAGRFLARHRLGAGLTVAIPLLIVAAGAWHIDRLSTERDRAAAAAERAEAAAAEAALETLKSEQVSAFLLDLFTQSDAWQRDGDEPTVRDLIARGAGSLDALAATPEVQLHMLGALARASLSIGDYDQAIRLLEASATRLEQTATPQTGEWVDLLNQLGEALGRAGRFNDAVTSHRRALEWLGPEESLARAQTLSNLGVPLRRLNRYEEAEQVQREALALIRRFQPGGTEEAMASNNLAVVLASSDQNSEARALFEKALALHRDSSGPEHPRTLTAMGNLATFLSDTGDLDAAEALMLETLDMRIKVLGEDHPRVSHMMHALGLLNDRRGNLDEAERWWLQALDLRAATVGTDHYSNGMTHHSLGVLAMRRGDLDQAEQRLLHALSIYRNAYGSDHRHIARAKTSLGELARQRGELATAEAHAQRALDMQRGLLGMRHSEPAMTLRLLAKIARDRSDHTLARELAEQSLEILESLYEDRDHPRIKSARELVVGLQP